MVLFHPQAPLNQTRLSLQVPDSLDLQNGYYHQTLNKSAFLNYFSSYTVGNFISEISIYILENKLHEERQLIRVAMFSGIE